MRVNTSVIAKYTDKWEELVKVCIELNDVIASVPHDRGTTLELEEAIMRLRPEAPPCTICGDSCCSQLEFMESNNGVPWEKCSGCDTCGTF